MSARIYQRPKNAMQSGKARTDEWVLEFEQPEARHADPLMGWTGSGDTQAQVQLTFPSKEEAKAYAAELIGSDVLEEALADKGIDEQIQVNLKLWGRYLDAAGVPLVILPAQTLKGTSNTTGEMIKLLGDKLGLEKDST